MEIFEQIHAGGNTIILITHEEYIANHSNRVVRLLDGLIQSDENKQ
jgi:putative ABC transport system ATP-binding protein